MQNFANVFSKSVSIIVAVMFIVIGSIFYFKYDPAAYDTEGVGVISEIDEHYEWVGDENELVHNVYIDYTANGETFEHAEYFEYNHKMKVGDTVEFFYMSDDPSQIAGKDKEMTPYFGLAFAAVGLIMLFFGGKSFAKKSGGETELSA